MRAGARGRLRELGGEEAEEARLAQQLQRDGGEA